MKHLMFAMCAVAMVSAFAAEQKVVVKPAAKPAAKQVKQAKAEKPAELTENKAPIVWGFANYGIYSGYQLYGSIVNTEPCLQGYAEVNFNLPFQVGAMDDLGYLGAGVWNNSDLTGKRTASYRRAFNEIDPNIHWGKTFWFDDKKTWGLTYRTSVVWYWYPATGGKRDGLGAWFDPRQGRYLGRGRFTATTMDWNHYLELANPYLIPYVNIVHEYRRSDGDLLQFGAKKPFQLTDDFSLCPFIEFVWRNHNYGWCFSNYGNHWEDCRQSNERIAAGIATMKLELDATYMFTKNIGIFAKVAYCQNIDPNLRQEANIMGQSNNMGGYGDTYGRWNEFCWGGAGVCVSF